MKRLLVALAAVLCLVALSVPAFGDQPDDIDTNALPQPYSYTCTDDGGTTFDCNTNTSLAWDDMGNGTFDRGLNCSYFERDNNRYKAKACSWVDFNNPLHFGRNVGDGGLQRNFVTPGHLTMCFRALRLHRQNADGTNDTISNQNETDKCTAYGKASHIEDNSGEGGACSYQDAYWENTEIYIDWPYPYGYTSTWVKSYVPAC
jgi:hypothetical protein